MLSLVKKHMLFLVLGELNILTINITENKRVRIKGGANNCSGKRGSLHAGYVVNFSSVHTHFYIFFNLQRLFIAYSGVWVGYMTTSSIVLTASATKLCILIYIVSHYCSCES